MIFQLYFQLVTTNEKLEMQIRNLNKNQSIGELSPGGNELSEESDLPSNFQNVEETSISRTLNANESGKSKIIFHIMVNGIPKTKERKFQIFCYLFIVQLNITF